MATRVIGIVLVLGMLIAGALLIANLRPSDSAAELGNPPPSGNGTKGGFSESLFKFAPAASDQAGGSGANWQTASATLSFSDTTDPARGTWSCNVVVGMPLQAEKWGKIAPDYAAYATAKTATDAATTVMSKNDDGSAANFCKQWREEMQSTFNGIKDLGAKVSGSE